ncbi:MAG: hypothetical protein ACLQVF_19585, partial [Isosphaeraceae bacterium]
MPRFKVSVSQRRRALAKKVDQLDRLESKVTITEPISVMGICIPALRTLAGIGPMDAAQFSSYPTALANRAEEAARRGTGNARPQIHLPAGSSDVQPIAVATRPAADSSGRSGAAASQTPAPSGETSSTTDQTGDWLNLSNAGGDSTESGIADPWQPAKPSGGGAAMAPRGGSGARSTGHGAIQPL